MVGPIVRVSIESASLSSLGYSIEEGVLEAEFKSGDLYRFFLVPASVWNELIAAPSKGNFFNQNIREKFPFVRIPNEAQTTDDLMADLLRSLAATKGDAGEQNN